jgi:hypothetical protein
VGIGDHSQQAEDWYAVAQRATNYL